MVDLKFLADMVTPLDVHRIGVPEDFLAANRRAIMAAYAARNDAPPTE